jgi:hypothetical protein
MKAAQRRQQALLDLLAGCPSGLTGAALKTGGHAAATLGTLVSHGYISATVERISEQDGMVRTRYRITPTGRKVRIMSPDSFRAYARPATEGAGQKATSPCAKKSLLLCANIM